MANLSSSNPLNRSIGSPGLSLHSQREFTPSSHMATSDKVLNTTFEDLLRSNDEEFRGHGSNNDSLPDETTLVTPVGADAKSPSAGSDELKQAFQDFVGKTFFSQLISSMRSTQQGSAYFNGGQAEKIFQGQLDQILTDEISQASSSQIAEPMYRLFQLQRSK